MCQVSGQFSGSLCETVGYYDFWKTGKLPSLTKDRTTYECRSENHVTVVAKKKNISVNFSECMEETLCQTGYSHSQKAE